MYEVTNCEVRPVNWWHWKPERINRIFYESLHRTIVIETKKWTSRKKNRCLSSSRPSQTWMPVFPATNLLPICSAPSSTKTWTVATQRTSLRTWITTFQSTRSSDWCRPCQTDSRRLKIRSGSLLIELIIKVLRYLIGILGPSTFQAKIASWKSMSWAKMRTINTLRSSNGTRRRSLCLRSLKPRNLWNRHIKVECRTLASQAPLKG